jgi:Carbohydrate esterase, sialic acid-specific acetylesterase
VLRLLVASGRRISQGWIEEDASHADTIGALSVARWELEPSWTDRKMLISVGVVVFLAAAAVAVGTLFAMAAFLFVRRLRRSLRQLRRELASIRQTFDDGLTALEGDLAKLKYDLKLDAVDPSEIVLTASDSYERLDQNWGSIRDTSGRQPSAARIEGERSRTAVIAILGQSNAANHGSGRYSAKHHVDNFNIYDGKCYHAIDPLLGASSDGGNFATRLGDKLIEAGLFDRIILAPIAMGGTTVEQWAVEGMFNRRIAVLIRRLFDAGLNIDFILWHQGEGNPGMGDVEGRQYRKNLLEVVDTFRRYNVNAPFFVALATFCGGPHNNAENIRAGQKSAVDPTAGIYLGPDTDKIGIEHRWDDCHFDETGLEMAASMWCEVIADFQAKYATTKPLTNRWTASRNESSQPLPKVPRPLALQSIMSCLEAAFIAENHFRPVAGPVILANERLATVSVNASEVASLLKTRAVPTSSEVSEQAEMVVAWEGLSHAFHPRAALDSLCGRVRPGGRLIYAQRLGGHCYLGLTPKWFLDHFVAARYSDCRVYALWPTGEAPAVATFDYQWMLKNAAPVYNPMWDNITHAEAIVIVAEKGADPRSQIPSQDIYRSLDEWKQYAHVLQQLSESSRPCHFTGPIPPRLPQGFRGVA